MVGLTQVASCVCLSEQLREHLIEYLPQCAALQSLSLRSATALVHKLLPVAPVSLRSLDLTNTGGNTNARWASLSLSLLLTFCPQ